VAASIHAGGIRLRPRVFATKADAMAAYRRGEINVDQPVEIVGER
jgi:hypothetical protein